MCFVFVKLSIRVYRITFYSVLEKDSHQLRTYLNDKSTQDDDDENDDYNDDDADDDW